MWSFKSIVIVMKSWDNNIFVSGYSSLVGISVYLLAKTRRFLSKLTEL